MQMKMKMKMKTITQLLPALLLGCAMPAAAGSLSLDPSFTGSWYDPDQSGHGLMLQVLPGNRILAAWLTFDAAGGQAWFVASGSYADTTAVVSAVDRPSGGRWIPNFDPARITHNAWGTLVFRFTDCNNGRVDFSSSDPAFGNGGMTLKRLTMPAGLTCP
jgi:hypothetical protein